MFNTVSFEDVFSAAKSLSRDEQMRLASRLRDLAARTALNEFDVGDEVVFTAKNGVTIAGVVEKVCSKNLKVSSRQDRYGITKPFDIKWTVAPQFCSRQTNKGL